MGFFIDKPASVAQAKAAPKVTGVPISTSVVGKVIPIVYGTTRVPGNMIWYGDFQKKKVKQSNDQGKGGIVGGGNASADNNTKTFTYKASFIYALCEGSIADVPTVYE